MLQYSLSLLNSFLRLCLDSGEKEREENLSPFFSHELLPCKNIYGINIAKITLKTIQLQS